MHVEQHLEAVLLCQLEHRVELEQERLAVLLRLRLERAPGDRKPERVEAVLLEARGVDGVEGAEAVHRQAPVIEGDIEDARHLGVVAAEDQLAAAEILKSAADDADGSGRQLLLGGDGGSTGAEESEQDRRGSHRAGAV
jgi:hypothetical protein